MYISEIDQRPEAENNALKKLQHFKRHKSTGRQRKHSCINL